MITDHPFIAAVVFGAACFAGGYHLAAYYSEVQIRRLQQANQTLRIMLNGVPFDDKPPATGKGVEAAEQRARVWWQSRRAKLKAERDPWPNYWPVSRRTGR